MCLTRKLPTDVDESANQALAAPARRIEIPVFPRRVKPRTAPSRFLGFPL
jgi:hypothetical protein